MELLDDYKTLIRYSITDEAIAEMRKKYLPIKCTGLEDKEGYDAAKDAKKEIVKVRTTIEKERKRLKEFFLEGGRQVDAPAKKIFNAIAPVEQHLQDQLDVIDKELERQAAEEQKRKNDLIDARIAELQKYKATFAFGEVVLMTASQFETARDKAKLEFEAAEKQRLEMEATIAEQKKKLAEVAEQNRLLEIENRKKQEELLTKQRVEIAEQEKELAAKNKQLADQERMKAEEEKKRAELEAQAKKDAADAEMFEAVKVEFPTLAAAWGEIVRLRLLTQK